MIATLQQVIGSAIGVAIVVALIPLQLRFARWACKRDGDAP